MESRSWYEQEQMLERVSKHDEFKANNATGLNREARRRLAAEERRAAKRAPKETRAATAGTGDG